MQKHTALILAMGLVFTSIFASAESLDKSHEVTMPPIQVGAEWQPGFDAVYAQLRANLHAPNKMNAFWHAHPAPKFPGVYLWDSSFISLIWKYQDPEVAQDIIRSVIASQQPDGRIPHVVSFVGSVSPWTQPPVLSYAAADIVSSFHDIAFANEIYESLKAYQNWLWRARRLKSGLFFWLVPYESGLDNSPRFSNRDESYFRDTTKMGAIDFSSYAVLDAHSMTTIAKFILSQTPAGSERADELTKDLALFDARATEETGLIRKLLWDANDGYFYDRDEVSGELIKIPTVMSFLPLLAKVADNDQWLALQAHLKNPQEFNTLIPVPTVARNSKYFEKDCWRGPVWVNTSYMTIKGLENYGDMATAHTFARRLISGIYETWKNTGKFVEYYDPERTDFKELTRKKGLGPFGLSASHNVGQVLTQLFGKRIFLGTKPVDHFIGWTGLVNTLAVEETHTAPPYLAR